MALAREIAKGAAWVLFFRLLSRGISLISIFILARLLTPSDFGIVALAMAMIAALELAANFSFDVALIQDQNATPDHYDTVWTITLLFQAAISVLLLLSAYPVADIFSEPSLGPALIVLSMVPIIEGLQNVRVVDFRKNMQFQKDFTFMLAKRLIGFAVTIPLAFYFRNYWALVIGTIAGRLGGTILSYMLIPNMPRLGIKHWRELFSFSKWLFINNLMFFLRYRASDFIIGKLAGARGLGVFEISNQIGDIPTAEVVAPINRAALPGLSKVNNDLPEFGANFLRIVGVILLIALPAGVGVAAVAEPLVHVALGDQWLDAIPVISVLAIASALGAIETNLGTACVALGRPDLVAKLYSMYVTVLLVLTAWFTMHWGVVGAAWAWLLTSVINVPIYYTVMLRAIGTPLRQFAAEIWRPILGSGVMFLTVRWYLSGKPGFSDALDALPALLAAVAIGAVVFTVTVALLWYAVGAPKGAEQEIFDQIKERTHSIRARLGW